MKKGFIWGIVWLIILVSITPALKIGDKAPDFVLSNLEGKIYRLQDFKGQVVVLEWIDYDCAYVSRLYEEKRIQSLQQTVQNLDQVWLTVVSGSQGLFWKRSLRKDFTNSSSLALTLLVDRKGVVGRLYLVPSVPLFIVIDRDGIIRYRGSFDNQKHLMKGAVQGQYETYLSSAFQHIYEKEVGFTDMTDLYGCDIRY